MRGRMAVPQSNTLNPWQLQYPRTYPEGSAAVLGPQETVQLVTYRAREGLNDHRETARCALLHQQGEVLAATRQCEAVAREKQQWGAWSWRADASSTARKRSRCAIFSKTEGIVISIFPGRKSSSWRSATNFGNGSNVRSKKARWAGFLLTLRTESSSTTRGRRFATTELRKCCTGQDRFRKHSHIERCLKNLELLVQLLDQKLIDPDEQRKNSYEKYDVTKRTEQKLRLFFSGFGQTWSLLKIQDFRRTAIGSRLTQGNYAIASISCATRYHTRSCTSKHEVRNGSPRDQKDEIQLLPRDLQSRQDSLSSWDEVNLNSL